MSRGIRHFKALVGKNFLLKRRRPWSSLLELLLPLAVAGLLAGVKSAIGPESMPTTGFTAWGSDINTIGNLREAAWLLHVQRKKLAVIGPSSIVDRFVSDMSTRYPSLDGSTFGGGFNNSRLRSLYIPGFADVITTAFTTESELESWVHSAEYPGNDPFPADPRAKGRVWAAVVFKSGPPHWEYSLRMNASEIPSTRAPYTDTLTRSESGRWNLWKYAYANPFFASDTALGDGSWGDGSTPDRRAIPGFMALQLAIDRWIIDLPLPPSALSLGDYSGRLGNSLWNLMGQDSQIVWNEVWDQNGNVTGMMHDMARYGIADLYAPHEVQMAPFPISAFQQQPFYSAAQFSTPLFFTLATLFPMSRLIRDIVTEKEARLRESMRMMGMGDAALLASWLGTAWLQAVITCVAVAGVLTMGGSPSAVFPGAGYGSVFLLFLLFNTASIMYAAFVSVWFSTARTASTLGSLAYLGAFFPFYATGTTDATVGRAGKLASCILPPTSFAMSLSHLMALEGSGSALVMTGPGANASIPLRGFAFTDGIAMLAGSVALFILLAWYADAVLPYPLRQYGTPRPWYFPVQALLRPCSDGRIYPWAPGKGQAGSRRAGGCPSPCRAVTTSNPFWRPKAGHGTDGPSTQVIPTSVSASVTGAVEAPDAYLRGKETSGQCVQLRGVIKAFRGPDGREHRAVDGMDLTLYEGQITVLLGHNGAGKTTLINVVTGLLPATAGTAAVFGQDLGQDFSAMHAQLGVCPQHDVLWPELTCMEHVRLFSAIKGLPAEASSTTALLHCLEEVGLAAKADARSSTLSGGQKRKLSLAIALLGDPRIVLLDEPTSGMDPYSRRATWELLRRNRAGRVIVLTTHFMDEADILGDKIAIMHAGRMHSYGTPMFLKSSFGVGYTLSVVLPPECGDVQGAVRLLTEAVKSHVPDASMDTCTGREAHFGLPMGAAPSFPKLLGMLEGLQHVSPSSPLVIDSFGLGVTTMEDVFLAVAGHGKAGHKAGKGTDAKAKLLDDVSSTSTSAGQEGSSSGPATTDTAYLPLDVDEGHSSASAGAAGAMTGHPGSSAGTAKVQHSQPSATSMPGGRSSYCRQTGALLAKRVVYARRDMKGACLQLLMPIVTVLLGLGLLQLGRILSGDLPSLRMSPAVQLNTDPQAMDAGAQYPNRVPAFNFKATDAYPNTSAQMEAIVRAMDIGQPTTYDSDGSRLSLSPELLSAVPDPYRLQNPGQADGPHNDGWPSHGYQAMSSYLISRQETVLRHGKAYDLAAGVTVGSGTLADALVGQRDPASVYGAVLFLLNGTNFQSQQARSESWLTSYLAMVTAGAASSVDYTMAVDPSTLNWEVAPHPSLTYGIMVNTSSYHAAPLFANLVHDALYRLRVAADQVRRGGGTVDEGAIPGIVAAATASGGAIGGITTYSHPLPYTVKEVASTSALFSFGAAAIVTIAFAFVPAAHASYVVKEREGGARQQQLLSGLSLPAYWSSNYVFDVAGYLLPGAVCILAAWGFGIAEFMGSGDIAGAFVALVMLYGVAVPPFAYLLSFAFKSSMSVTTSVLMVSVFSVILIIASMVLSQLPLTCLIEAKVRHALLLLPGYAFGNGMVKLAFLSSLPVLDAICTVTHVDKNADYTALAKRKFLPLETTVVGWNLIYLACQAVVYTGLVLLLDYYQTGALSAMCQRRSATATDSTVHSTPVPDEDEDVAQERQRVEALVQRRYVPEKQSATMDDSDQLVLLRQLRKVYSGAPKAAAEGPAVAKDKARRTCCRARAKGLSAPVAAVQNLSFAVPAGEVFGFLGINGAGKTTTMEMLTGRLPPTSGSAWLAGYDAIQERTRLARTGLLGYCPQHDPLLDLLTPREHLYLYGRLRGVPEGDLPVLVDRMLKSLDLGAFADSKTAGSLSGGNKRKLSVAISLIGSPPIVFLDEPSTGMDPVAKRAVWEAVRHVTAQVDTGHAEPEASKTVQLKAGSASAPVPPGTGSGAGHTSVILTTHSMEEAEALATRIGIMVGGRLRCLGTAQHLKRRLGRGYQLQVQLAGPSADDIAAASAAIMGVLGRKGNSGTTQSTADGAAVAVQLDTAVPAHATSLTVAEASRAVQDMLGAYSGVHAISTGIQEASPSADTSGTKAQGTVTKAAVVDMEGWRAVALGSAASTATPASPAPASTGPVAKLSRGVSGRLTDGHKDDAVPLADLAMWLAQERQVLATVLLLTQGQVVPWLSNSGKASEAAMFAGGHVIERHGLSLRLHLATGSGDAPAAPLSTLFGAVEFWRASLGVAAYSLSESTLEQVFNTFAGAAASSTTAHTQGDIDHGAADTVAAVSTAAPGGAAMTLRTPVGRGRSSKAGGT